MDENELSNQETSHDLMDRRRLMWAALAASAGAGAALVGSMAEPAAAANGSPVLLGKSNSASATTLITTSSGTGLLGRSTATGGVALRGESSTGNGVFGLTGGSGAAALLGRNTNTSQSGYGVRGITTFGEGVRGESVDGNGKGVAGRNNATTGGIGVYGFSAGQTSYGVYGDSPSSTAVYGIGDVGVHGETASDSSYGVYGKNTASEGYGVYGVSKWGVHGESTVDGGHGVEGKATGLAGIGVTAQASGQATLAFAAFGDASVTGSLTKGSGTFKIDHPVDPANKYLSHSFVESPDMMNIYNGNVVLDRRGRATVTMPDWFEALNKDFRYQLTALEGAAPRLHVSRLLQDGTFSIAGGKSGMTVSWMVTGVRQDAFANAHRTPIEQDKPESERGRYLHPELFGSTQSVHDVLLHQPTPAT